jgi:DNA polymerase III delta subunit
LKYKIDSAETEYEPGAGDLVLRNKLAIVSEADINEADMNEAEDFYFKSIRAGLEGDIQYLARLVRDTLARG